MLDVDAIYEDLSPTISRLFKFHAKQQARNTVPEGYSVTHHIVSIVMERAYTHLLEMDRVNVRDAIKGLDAEHLKGLENQSQKFVSFPFEDKAGEIWQDVITELRLRGMKQNVHYFS